MPMRVTRKAALIIVLAACSVSCVYATETDADPPPQVTAIDAAPDCSKATELAAVIIRGESMTSCAEAPAEPADSTATAPPTTVTDQEPPPSGPDALCEAYLVHSADIIRQAHLAVVASATVDEIRGLSGSLKLAIEGASIACDEEKYINDLTSLRDTNAAISALIGG